MNTKTLSTARKLQDDLVLDSRKSPILKREDSTRYRSACVRLSCLAQDRLDLAETAKHLAQRMSGPCEFDSIPLKGAARYLVGMPKAALRFQRQEHEDKITVFMGSAFAGDPVTRKSTTGLVGQIGNQSHCEIWIHCSELDSPKRWRSGVPRMVKGGQVGLFLRSIYMDLGIPMKVEIQGDDWTANYSTDRL